MSKIHDRGAARATAKPSRRKPLAGTATTSATGAAAVSQEKGPEQTDEISLTGRDAELLARPLILEQQGDVGASLEEEEDLPPDSITDTNEDLESGIIHALFAVEEPLRDLSGLADLVDGLAAASGTIAVSTEALCLICSHLRQVHDELEDKWQRAVEQARR
jgi:hypothetical protein